MNELEKEIGCQLTPFIVSDKDSEGSAFKKGADFVLSKNLMSKFYDWMQDHEDELFELLGTDNYTTEQAEFYWINNIYGK